jgi:SulP family sulfate permease
MSTKNLKGDLFGGLTTGVVALPLALAFGDQTELGATAGLYGAIIVGFFAALFGGTPSQVSGPTAPMTLVALSVIVSAKQVAGSLEEGMWMIILTFLLAGILQIVFGVAKFGNYIKYIPYPVVSGFMSGIGAIIFIQQIFPLLGESNPGGVLEILTNLPQAFGRVNSGALILGLGTIGIIYGLPRVTKAVPASLVALVVMTVVSVLAAFAVPTIGEIPSGLPALKLSAFSQIALDKESIQFIIQYGLSLALLGTIDSLLTSVVADNITKTRHNSRQELIGQGLGNIIASLFGALPGAGATVRTVVNVNAGGRTRISGMIHSLLLLVVLLGAGKYAAMIPKPVLAGILFTVGLGIIDYKALKHMNKVPRADVIVMLIVFGTTVLFDLLWAVGLGMVLACFFFMQRISEISENRSTVTKLEPEEPWEDELDLQVDATDKIFIKHLFGPLTFGFITGFKELTKLLPDHVQLVVIRMERVPYMDQSGLYALEDMVFDLNEKKVAVVITDAGEQPLDMMRQIQLVPNIVPEERCFDQFTDFIDWLTAEAKSNPDLQFFE